MHTITQQNGGLVFQSLIEEQSPTKKAFEFEPSHADGEPPSLFSETIIFAITSPTFGLRKTRHGGGIPRGAGVRAAANGVHWPSGTVNFPGFLVPGMADAALRHYGNTYPHRLRVPLQQLSHTIDLLLSLPLLSRMGSVQAFLRVHLIAVGIEGWLRRRQRAAAFAQSSHGHCCSDTATSGARSPRRCRGAHALTCVRGGK